MDIKTAMEEKAIREAKIREAMARMQ